MDQYDRLLTLLSGYVSPLNARSVLNRALSHPRIERHQLVERRLAEIVPRIGRAAQLFIDPARSDSLEKELRALVGDRAPPTRILVEINGEADIVRARAAGRRICETFEINGFSVQKVATIISELSRNIASYVGRGQLEIVPISGRPPRVQIVAEDAGPGISGIDRILAGQYKSKTGLGLGILGSKRLADRFDIQTGAGGTRIEVEVIL